MFAIDIYEKVFSSNYRIDKSTYMYMSKHNLKKIISFHRNSISSDVHNFNPGIYTECISHIIFNLYDTHMKQIM